MTRTARFVATHRLITSLAVLHLTFVVGCDPFGFAPAVTACDIVADSGCPDGSTCVNVAKPTCVTAGTGTHGDSCSQDEDCAIKHLCVGAVDGARTCQRRCNLRKPTSCKEFGVAENNAVLKESTCLWVTDSGARDLGYCSSPQCVPASNEGCADKQKCVGGIEPRCVGAGDTITVTIDGKTVTYQAGGAALDAACMGPGHCVVGGICASVTTVKGVSQRCMRACKIGSDGKTPTTSEACAEAFVCKPLRYTSADGSTDAVLPDGQGFCRLAHCNLVSNEGCATGEKCIGTQSGTPACTLSGNTPLMGTCDQLSDCDTATTCVSGGSKALCVLKCDTTGTLADKGCADGQTCSALMDKDGNPKPSHLGFCVPK